MYGVVASTSIRFSSHSDMCMFCGIMDHLFVFMYYDRSLLFLSRYDYVCYFHSKLSVVHFS